MPSVRLPLLAFFACASPALAGVIITVFPSSAGPYAPGQPLQLDVWAQIYGSGPASSRVQELQFDFARTQPLLDATTVLTHPATKTHGDIYFWNFSTAPNCQSDPQSCGNANIIDGDLDLDQLVKVTYASLTEDFDSIRLVASGPRRIGSFQVTAPDLNRETALVDVLNAESSDPLRGAQLTFGYGTPGNPTVHWSAHDGTIAGGQYRFWIPELATLVLLLLGVGWITTKHTRQLCRISSKVTRSEDLSLGLP